MFAAHEMRCWPPPGGGVAEVERPKVAAAASYDIQSVVGRVMGAVRSWSDIPAGTKTASLRDDGSPAPGVTRANIWRHPNASPAVLTLMLLDAYGEEYVEWEPQTLRLTLDRDGHKLSDSVWTKILAARAILGSPSPWRQWEVFHFACLGLAGHAPNFSFLEEPEIGHLIVGVEFMHMMDPEREIQEEVDKFIAAAFQLLGSPHIPAPLDFAQEELEEPQLRCLNCGSINDDDNDQRCVTCASVRLESIPYEHTEDRDRAKQLFTQLNTLPLEAALDQCPDDWAGNAVYQMLIHWEYASDARVNTVQQLRMIGGK